MNNVIPLRSARVEPDNLDTSTMTVEELGYFTGAPVLHVIHYREIERRRVIDRQYALARERRGPRSWR